MASKPSAQATLFNDPLLSDMKLLQVYKGKTKEYHIHKQILSSQSKYFRNAFTGNFKEATDKSMKIHDDDPVHFKTILKFMYTGTLDCPKADSTAPSSQEKVDHLMGLCKVADKYDVFKILPTVAKELSDALKNICKKKVVPHKDMFRSYYSCCALADTAPGRIIASHIVKRHSSILNGKNIADLVKEFPVFGADITLEHHQRGMLGCFNRICAVCGAAAGVHLSGMIKLNGYCSTCDDYQELKLA